MRNSANVPDQRCYTPGNEIQRRRDASTSAGMDANSMKGAGTVMDDTPSSPTAFPDPITLPVFQPITERIDALYRELIQGHSAPNPATKWTVRDQAVRILEREQERVTRIHEAFYRGMARRVSDPTRTGEEA